MDIELIGYLEFYNNLLIHLRNIYIDINRMQYDEKLLLSYKDTNSDIPIVKNLNGYNQLVSELNSLLSLLKNTELIFVEELKNNLIFVITTYINELSDDPQFINEQNYAISYSKDYVLRTLYDAFYNIFVKADDLIIEMYKKISAKNRGAVENVYLGFPNFDSEIVSIKKLFNEIVSKLPDGKSKEYLIAARLSFDYSMIQFDHSIFNIVYLSEKFKNMKNFAQYSYLTSCLFMLISAYDKTMFSIASTLGVSIDEKRAYIGDILNSIKVKDNNLHLVLQDSERKKEVEVARDIRNGFTHRITKRTPSEIHGFLVSLIYEIKRILEIFEKQINP